MDNDRNAPATKGDLLDAKDELRAEMKSMEDRLKSEIRTEMKSMEDRMVETFRDVQTELLKAFYSFTESNQQRVTQVEGNQAALIARVGTLEARVTELERRVKFPEHPTQ
jgi:hypothetical protein